MHCVLAALHVDKQSHAKVWISKDRLNLNYLKLTTSGYHASNAMCYCLSQYAWWREPSWRWSSFTWWFSYSSGLSIHSSPSETNFRPWGGWQCFTPPQNAIFCYGMLWLLNLLSSTFTPNTPQQSSLAIELNSLLKDNYAFPPQGSAGSSLSSPWTANRLGSRPRNLFCSWTIAGLARRTIRNAFQQVMGTS